MRQDCLQRPLGLVNDGTSRAPTVRSELRGSDRSMLRPRKLYSWGVREPLASILLGIMFGLCPTTQTRAIRTPATRAVVIDSPSRVYHNLLQSAWLARKDKYVHGGL